MLELVYYDFRNSLCYVTDQLSYESRQIPGNVSKDKRCRLLLYSSLFKIQRTNWTMCQWKKY